MIVVDASALVEVLLRTPGAEALQEALFGAGHELHAPELLDLEVLNVLRSREHTKRIGPRRASEGTQDLAEAPILRHPHGSFRERIWGLRGNLTPYDAAYVALAEGLGATLVTLDARLARAAARLVPVAGV